MAEDQDFLSILAEFTSYVQNERVRSFNEGVDAERKRCAAIVSAARMGKVDTDFRSIGNMIKDGEDVATITFRL